MKAIILNIAFIFSFALGVSAQSNTDDFNRMVKSYYKESVDLIYPHQLYQKMLSDENIIILDTREKNEYRVSQIKDSYYVGYNKFELKGLPENLAKDQTIIVYCTIGARSENIGEKLKKEGFTNVYNLYGGIIFWNNQGYPLINLHQNNTDSVHVYSDEWGKWLTKGKATY